MGRHITYDNAQEYRKGLQEILTEITADITANSDKIVSFMFAGITDDKRILSGGAGESVGMSMCFNILLQKAIDMGYPVQIYDYSGGE